MSPGDRHEDRAARRRQRLMKAGGSVEDDLCPHRKIDRVREPRPTWVVRRMHDQRRRPS